MQRRSFIKKGMLGSVLFTVEPVVSLANEKLRNSSDKKDPYENHGFLFLDEEDLEFFKAVCPIMLGQVSSRDQWPPEKIMFEVIKGVDIAISQLSVPTQ